MENINVGQGISKDEDPYEAGKQAAKQAMEKYDGEEKPDIGFIFCSGSKYGKDDDTIEKFVEGADEGFGDVEWVGCTSAGEISKEGLTKKSAVATVIKSDMMYWGIHAEEIDPENPRESGKKAAKGALDNLDIDKMVHSYSQYQFLKKADTSEMVTSDPYNMIVLAQGPTIEGAGFGIPVRLIRGVKDVIESNPIVGGLSGDDERALRDYQFHNGNFFTDSIICVGFVTTLKTTFRISHGYSKTGQAALATEVENNEIGKLNNEPAAEEYARLLDKNISDLFPKNIQIARKLKLENSLAKLMVKRGKNIFQENPLVKSGIEHPLGFTDENDNIWVKMPGDLDKEKRLICLNEVKDNSGLQVLSFDSKKVYNSSKNDISSIIDDLEDKGLIFAFECFTRCMLFQDEVENASEEYLIEEDIVPLGFASYGELGTTEQGVSGGQNGTLTMMGISDEVFTQE